MSFPLLCDEVLKFCLLNGLEHDGKYLYENKTKKTENVIVSVFNNSKLMCVLLTIFFVLSKIYAQTKLLSHWNFAFSFRVLFS